MKESQNIEWKESWRDEYIKWICGFSNAAGDMLVIGKNDKRVITRNRHRCQAYTVDRYETGVCR